MTCGKQDGDACTCVLFSLRREFLQGQIAKDLKYLPRERFDVLSAGTAVSCNAGAIVATSESASISRVNRIREFEFDILGSERPGW
jgi:hypothetical protein